MKVDRVSVSLDAQLGKAVRQRATNEGLSLSGWMAQAAQAKLHNELLEEALNEWEAEDGAFTPDELRTAENILGLHPAIARP